MSTAQILETLQGIKSKVDAQETRLNELAASNEQARKNPGFHVRKGEDPLGSRGFQFSRVAGVACKKLEKDQAKVEIDICSRLQKEYVERGLYRKEVTNSIVVPFSSELLQESAPEMEKFSAEVAEVVKAGISGYDPSQGLDLMNRVRRKTLSWSDAGALAELVGQPIMGEPIELLRNKEVFLSLGAKLIPFPQSGRVVWPRWTGATTAEWIGSGVNDRTIPESEPTTSDLVLTVKKLGVRVTIPNELFRFPTVAVEGLIRADMALSASLKMDKAFLEGTGSAFEPKGIINYDNIVHYTAGQEGVDGDSLDPEDILQIIAEIEENNVDFGGWVGRPRLYAGLGNKRADAVTAGDKRGHFLFNVLRDGTSNSRDVKNYSVGSLEGYPFHKSNQISKLREKGSATDLTYLLGGQFGHYMVAMSGVMEFAMANQGDTIFPQDQSVLRLITWCDGGPRYEEAFVLVDSLLQTA